MVRCAYVSFCLSFFFFVLYYISFVSFSNMLYSCVYIFLWCHDHDFIFVFFLSSCYDRVGSVYLILIRSIFLFLIYILSFLMMSFRLLCSFSLFVWSDWLDLPDCIIMAEPAQSSAAKCRRQVHHI